MKKRFASGRVALAVGTLVLTSVVAPAQVVERLSVGPGGVQANGHTSATGASSDGRFVLMLTTASNLVPVDTNGNVSDAVLRDRVTQVNTLVGLDLNGAQFQNYLDILPRISADGSTIVYAGTDSTTHYLFALDRVSGTRTLLDSMIIWPTSFEHVSLSTDGRFVAIYKEDSTHERYWIHVHDRSSGTTVQHVYASGGNGNASTRLALGDLSADGRHFSYRHYYADLWGTNWNEFRRFDRALANFQTVASASGLPLATPPTAFSADGQLFVHRTAGAAAGLYLRDLQAGTSELLSVTTDGSQDTSVETSGLLSADARWVAFASASASLVAADTNAATDIFLRDRATGTTKRASVGAGGVQPNSHSKTVTWLSPTASHVLFTSTASNLVPGDTNASEDVFLVELCQLAWADLDGDGYGAGASQMLCPPIPAGWSTRSGDCDDTNPARNPAATELCNGIDDDCDLLVDEGVAGVSYCTSATTPAGCTPLISATGCPSVSQPAGFVLRVDGCAGQRSGLLVYGASQTLLSFGFGNPSFLCIAAPRQRMAPQSSGGISGQCNGTLVTDFLAWTSANPGALLTPLAAGQPVNFQGWIREPAFPKGSMLSDAWSVTLAP